MARVIDYAPDVLAALAAGPLTQGKLTEAVWGSSGRNNLSLLGLLEYLVGKGRITLTRRGRAKWYALAAPKEA